MNATHHDEIIQQLKDGGFRVTRLRSAVVRELDQAKQPLTAAQLMARLASNGLTPHKTSVYREINFMIEQAIVTRLTFGERQDRFELAAMAHHHHAVCERCGEIEDIDCSSGIRKIEEKLQTRDFQVRFHMVEFIGLCKKCRCGPVPDLDEAQGAR